MLIRPQSAGIGWGLVLPMFANSIPVLPLPGQPPSTDALLEALKYGCFDWAFLLPVIIAELSKDAEALKLVASRLKYLFYTGAALPQAAGEVVSSKIPVFSALGSSECAVLPQLRADDASSLDTWLYVHINPAAGPEFRHHMDDLHQLVIVKSAEQSGAQPVFAMFPHLDEYETRDLFSPHPSLPHLWRHGGRRDDIVVFLNGEKTNPISFEQEVSRHGAVHTALVAGTQRFEACLLIEPTNITGTLSDSAKAALIQDIWPTVEEANRCCPAHARISKSKILILDPDRPMLRAGKGTVQREGTLRLYAGEIDALYDSDTQDQDRGQHTDGVDGAVSIPSLEDAVKTLRALVADVTSWSHFGDDTDFFSAGMDSLQTLRLGAAIRSSFRTPSISPAVIYKNPSVNLLATQLCRPLQHTTAGDVEGNRTAAVASLLLQYEEKIDQIASKGLPPPSQTPETMPAAEVVLLTGSTGTVGSFLLNRLLADSRVSHIYCLNRTHDSLSLQRTRNLQRGLPCNFPPDRVTFLTADLAKSHLGLDDDLDTYTTLLDRTTQIIHTAWPVDFNQPLRLFQPSLDGLVALISFAYHARPRPSLLFLSSISAVSAYDMSPLVPEEPIPADPSCPAAPIGYGESKHVAERVLAYAATRNLGSCFGVARIGQVAGASSTARGWNQREWLPSLVLSSRRLRALPGSLGEGGRITGSVDWVPVDDLASILIELSFSLAKSTTESRGGGNLQVFHCVNPHPIPWQDLVPDIVRVLSASLGSGSDGTDKVRDDEEGGVQISVVEFREWLQRLENSATTGGPAPSEQDDKSPSLATDLDRNPALRLLDFYHRLIRDGAEDGPSARLSLEKTVLVSKSLAKLGPIRPEWMSGWVQDWLNH